MFRMKPDVIFIGSGPIGLLGAIQLKLSCPETDILMFEKYENPVRSHAMYLNHGSFTRMNRTHGFGELIDAMPGKVIIREFELELRAFAVSLGIDICFQQVDDFKELEKEFPDTKYFIGSGGLRGILHSQVFNSDNQVNEPLRYAVEVKYKAEGSVRKLGTLTEVPGVLAHTKHLVSEFVGHEKNGSTPVSLRIFIDEETSLHIREATYKNPFLLDDPDHREKMPSDLLDSIETWLSARRRLAHEIIEDDAVKITMITLSLYASRDFCRETEGKVIFKIGEEAFACPFYRSFNDNAYCIPYFTKAMKALLQKTPVTDFGKGSSRLYSAETHMHPPEYYQKAIQKFINREMVVVHMLNSGITGLEMSAATSRKVPLVSGSKLMSNEDEREFLRERKYSLGSSSCMIL